MRKSFCFPALLLPVFLLLFSSCAVFAGRNGNRNKPSLLLCGDNRILHLDTRKVLDKSYEEGFLWEWSSAAGDHIDECKLVSGGSQVLATCSNNGGWCKLIDYKTKNIVLDINKGVLNAHSACLLPGDRVVVACSTGTDALKVFDLNNAGAVLCQSRLESAHGVVYGENTGYLYAFGDSCLQILELADWDTSTPSLKLVRSLSTAEYVTGGHDLNYVDSSTLSLAGNGAALFDINTCEFSRVGIFGPPAPKVTQRQLKSFNYNSSTREAWFTKGGDGDFQWTTHIVRHTSNAMSESGTQDHSITASDFNIYKVRVVIF